MVDPEKIKLFKFTQKTYQDIGIFPSEFDQSRRRSIDSKKWFTPFCLAQYSFSTAAYIWFEAHSMIEYGMAIFDCMSVIISSLSWLILFLQMEDVLNSIENCDRFIEKRVHSKILYKQTNEKIEQVAAFFGYGLHVSIFIFLLPSLFYTIVNYYILDLGKESFFLFFPTWWPFDWKTPIGYLVAWLAQFAGIAAILKTAISSFDTIFGSTWLFIVMVGDITNDVTAFNSIVKMLKEEDHVELMERFCAIIQYYSHAKEMVSDFNGLCEYAYFIFFTWDMLSISSLLTTLQFQLWSKNANMIEIWILSMLKLWMIGFNLAICGPGERVTGQFEKFHEKIDRCKWNKLPIKMQRMYSIFISDTQKPKNIQSYGGIMCTRETFKKITTKGFSYFMTLRNFRE